jgi:hypothetical protein
MKKIIILAAVVLGTAMTQQAVACDWMHHEAASAQTASACDGSNCTPAPTAQQAPAEAPSPAAKTVEEESDASAPMTVACHGSNC